MLNNLTLLSYGGGQDSETLLSLYVHNEDFRKTYVPGRFLVIMSDTGNEHETTYSHVEKTKQFCKDNNIEFVLITKDMGYHGNNWGSLIEQYQAFNTIGSKAFPKTCTDRLKIKPIYKFLEDWLADNYDLNRGRKKAYHEFADKYGKIKVLIGIAKDEESRQADPEKEDRVWYKKAISISYPLIELGLNRQGCHDYLNSINRTIPTPSNCKFCPWISEQELLWLYRFDRKGFDFWCELEAKKLEANTHKGDKNIGVWGKYNKKENKPFTLFDALNVAKSKYDHMTDDELHDYKMSHGHCVQSKY